jgi:hypothetical protein
VIELWLNRRASLELENDSIRNKKCGIAKQEKFFHKSAETKGKICDGLKRKKSRELSEV